MELVLIHGTVAQIEIDQALIRDSHFFRDGFEIGHRTRLSLIVTGCFKFLIYGFLRPFISDEIVMFSHTHGNNILPLMYDSSTYPVRDAGGVQRG